MQEDIHFYGTYAMASAAGIPDEDAEIIAYAAQFVDDSTKDDSNQHPDGGLLYGIATAHTGLQAVANSFTQRAEQRRVWIPFHFLPGGKGDTLEKQLICTPGSDIAEEMMDTHISTATQKDFGLELMGIAAHVYMDTFAHYGFSGISSEYNEIVDKSLVPVDVKDPKMKRYVLNKMGKFFQKFNCGRVASFLAERSTFALGHGAVATFPDRPYLKYNFEYTLHRDWEETTSERNNQDSYLSGCEKLYSHFKDFAGKQYSADQSTPFESIRESIVGVIQFEGNKEERSRQWIDSGLVPEGIVYNPNSWENDKKTFEILLNSQEGIEKSVYRFHQAAAYHRYYVLKDLLPAHGIAVY